MIAECSPDTDPSIKIVPINAVPTDDPKFAPVVKNPDAPVWFSSLTPNKLESRLSDIISPIPDPNINIPGINV